LRVRLGEKMSILAQMMLGGGVSGSTAGQELKICSKLRSGLYG